MHSLVLTTLRRLSVVTISACAAVLIVSCATSPEGRTQLKLLPDEQVRSMGIASFEDIKKKTPQSKNQNIRDYVQCIADAIIPQLPKENDPRLWEVRVFDDKQVNAFALPGNKIGVYEGLLEYATNQDQVATVIGHELAHVLAEHGNERISDQLAAEVGVALVVSALGGDMSESDKRRVVAGLGLGVQYGIILPFSRAHESEADMIGLDLMAKSGFNPRQSVKLWQNMSKAGDQPPEFLSTHPSGRTRIEQLNERMPQALDAYSRAQAQNRVPDCRLSRN